MVTPRNRLGGATDLTPALSSAAMTPAQPDASANAP
jgi:hypothetical protein